MAKNRLLELSAAFDCMHCGLCLDACPTYQATGQENHSPRGRVALMRAVAENRIHESDVFESVDACLLCRACEPACPSQVNYHSVVEEFRQGRTPWVAHAAKPWISSLLRFFRRIGLLGLAERFGGKRIAGLAGSVPQNATALANGFQTPSPTSPIRGTVGLHLGCVQKEFFGPSLQATVELLAKEGFQVEIPDQPDCCGSSFSHFGDHYKGNAMATATGLSFSKDWLAVISLSAGCTAHMESKFQLPVMDPLLFLKEQGLRSTLTPSTQRIAWDPPCQLEHVLRQANPMREFLQKLLGDQFLEPERSDLCCGAGGITFATAPEVSDAVTALKVDALLELEPQILLSANPPCRMRLEHGLRAAGKPIPVLHPVDWLLEAVQENPN